MSVALSKPIATPYDVRRSSEGEAQLRFKDRRKSWPERRLLWRDGLLLRDGRYVVPTRWMEAGVVSSGSVELEGVRTSTPSRWSPAAFDAVAETSLAWKPQRLSAVKVELSSLTPVFTVDEPLRQLGLPDDLGLNPLLEMPFFGKRLLIPALSLLHAVAAPSYAVFRSLMHPLDTTFMARIDPESSIVQIGGARSFHAMRLLARHLACLAYWLDDRMTDGLDLLSCVLLARPLDAPRGRGQFEFLVDGYENQDTIVARSLGDRIWRPCWPMNWQEVRLITAAGRLSAILSLAADGTPVIERFLTQHDYPTTGAPDQGRALPLSLSLTGR